MNSRSTRESPISWLTFFFWPHIYSGKRSSAAECAFLPGRFRRHELSRVRRDLVSADLLPRDHGYRAITVARSPPRVRISWRPIRVNEMEKLLQKTVVKGGDTGSRARTPTH